MSYTWEQIQSMMSARRRYDAPIIRRMVSVRDHYNGDITVPLVNVDGQPEVNVLMPFMVADGIDAVAMRAAGPSPNIHIPALDPFKETGKRSLEYAHTRRRALYAAWDRSFLPLSLRRAFRQLVGYGTFAFVVTPDHERECAVVEFRDALSTYPEYRAPEDIRQPENVGFVYGKSPEWISSRYPKARPIVEGWQSKQPNETMWDMVEWIDDEDIVIGVLAPRSLYNQDTNVPSIVGTLPTPTGIEVARWPNRAGMVPVVVPRRVTMDRLQGQMEKILPIEEWSAKLMALDYVATERHVFPDMVVLGEDNRTPQLVNGGGWRDGRTGEANMLQGVKAVQQLQASPGPLTNAMLDRLERNARISGGVSPFFSGEQNAQMRTGRGVDALGGFSVDPRIQEVQQIMGYGLQVVNKAIIAVEKGYWPSKKYAVFSGWSSDIGLVEYTPEIHFETDDNAVSYTFPGSDISQITVGLTQMLGTKLMSRHTARAKHPFIEDADLEERLIVMDSVDDAMILSFSQAVAQGQMAWQDLAAFRQTMTSGKVAWPDAIIQVHEAAQARQAQQAAQMQAAQAGGPGGEAGMGPDVQPGLGGGPVPVSSIPPPQQGLLNVASLVRATSAGPRAAKSNPMPVG